MLDWYVGASQFGAPILVYTQVLISTFVATRHHLNAPKHIFRVQGGLQSIGDGTED